jgi:3-oxoacyl-[acyl-carrier-protein] synthase III
MRPEMSLRSDSAVSCLVTLPGAGPGKGIFDLLAIVQENAPEQRIVDESAAPGALQMAKFRHVRTVAKRLLADLQAEPRSFRRVITNNYNKEIAKTFVSLCGFPTDRGFYANIPRLAHAVAGDVLINLDDLAAAGGLEPHDRVLLITDSISSTSAFCVEKRP